MEQFAIGIDIGGTKIKGVLVDSRGKLLDEQQIATEAVMGARKVLGKIADLISNMSLQNPATDISTIGIGVAGQVDSNAGTVIYAPNLNWRNVDICGDLKRMFRKPIAVCNDVRAATLAEWTLGAGAGCNDLVCIFAGTGVGGGIVSGGKMLTGINNSAGEIGHLTVQIDGPLCTCGNKGCLEAIAGGWAIQKEARQVVHNDSKAGATILALANNDVNEISAQTVATAARAGDKAAGHIIAKVTEALICGVVSIVNLVGPRRIILGGGIINANPELVSQVTAGVRTRALHAAAAGLEVLASKLGGEAGAIGAALVALKAGEGPAKTG